MDGTVERNDENGFVLRFERHLPHPIEKVWGALTEPAQLTKWIAGDTAEIELRPGGRVFFSGHGGIESTVTAVDPPRLLEYGWTTSEWDGGPIRFELHPEGDGTRLVFTHRNPKTDPQEQRRLMEKMGFGPEMFDPIPRTLAGWHSLLGDMQRMLDGMQPAPDDEWKPLLEHYKRLVVGQDLRR